MNKNSIIGLILIGIVIFGFSWIQSRDYKKQRDAQYQLDSAARAEYRMNAAMDSFRMLKAADSIKTVEPKTFKGQAYKDSLLSRAASSDTDFAILSNDLLRICFTSKGAQPYSVNLKEFKAYGGDSLYLMKPASSDFNIGVYAGESINTRDFDFTLAQSTDSSLVYRLYFSTGGYIQQEYVLPKDSYVLYNTLSFNDMDGVIARNVSYYDIDWTLAVPRLEKGYKNEKQYSKLDVYFEGDSKPEVIGRGGRNASKRYQNRLQWFDFNQQFFSAIMTAPEGGFASGDFSVKFAEENDPDHTLMNCSAVLRNDLNMVGGTASCKYEFFFGPNNYRLLRAFDRKYDKVIPIGGNIIGLITRYIIIPSFEFLSRFISNFGLIILLLTIFIKLIISPLTVKSYMSSAKMNALRPEMDKLNEKFPKASSDQAQAMKKQQATMELYKRAGVNPAGGCIPMLLQFPILWAMFRFFPASIELRQQPFLWAEDLSAYDSIVSWNTSVLGLDHLSLFALLMAVSMFFYSLMTMPQSKDPQMAPMRFMSVWVMPVMMFFICNSLSAGLSYYYLLSNIITMIQTFVIKKWFVKPEELLARIEASKGKPLPKSKWQMRLEAAQKMAEQQQKARRK